MSYLHLNLKTEYFDQIKAGEKLEEYRLATPYWRKRLLRDDFKGIYIKKGYPRSDDKENIIYREWRGCELKQITHKHFGNKPVTVFAIDVRGG